MLFRGRPSFARYFYYQSPVRLYRGASAVGGIGDRFGWVDLGKTHEMKKKIVENGEPSAKLRLIESLGG